MAFYAAIGGEHAACVKQLLSAISPLFAFRGETPLFQAVKQGNMACVKLLAPAGGLLASVENGASAVEKAVQEEQADLLKAMLRLAPKAERKAAAQAAFEKAKTLSHWAIADVVACMLPAQDVKSMASPQEQANLIQWNAKVIARAASESSAGGPKARASKKTKRL